MIKINLKKLSLYSHALMILTSIHHIYGAIIYQTTWRFHTLFISVPAIIFIALLSPFLLNRPSLKRSLLFWIYCLIIVLVSIGLIGCYEGIYNHLVKDLLFYSGVDRAILLQLFPPPTYEMPNDFFFEFTGVLQAILAVILIIYFIRLMKSVIITADIQHPNKNRESNSVSL